MRRDLIGREKEKHEAHVSYSTDGRGNWHRREWKPQCSEMVFLHGECQGVEGHKGVHWCFSERGDFCYDDNENDSTENGCSGSIPPDHKSYRTPLEMVPHRHMSHYADTTITDPVEIARLEKNKTRVGESIDRPATPEMIETLKDRIGEADKFSPIREDDKPKVG